MNEGLSRADTTVEVRRHEVRQAARRSAWPDGFNAVAWRIPASYPTSSSTDMTFHVQQVVSVLEPGTYTYYLNGYMYLGYSPNSDAFFYANMNAVYYP